jgi:hypothetical protein
MSVAELFYHENLFVGCLGLSRRSPHKTGDVLSTGALAHTLSTQDAQSLADTMQSQLFSLGDNYFSLMTQAMDYDSLNKCPALGDNHYCAVHDKRKPAVCSLVPFDSLYPDSLQTSVLLSRQFEEGCIVAGQKQDYPVIIKNRQILDETYQTALQKRRDDLVLEKQFWANAVFAELKTELLHNRAEINKIPLDNSIVLLSIIPVLIQLAQVSDKCRLRCLHYIDSQLSLIDNKIAQAIQRKTIADKKTTQEFRSFKEKYLKLRPALIDFKINPTAFSEKQVQQLEMYLS